MEWITRSIESQFDSILKKGKVLVTYGARRVGKTSVIEKLQKHLLRLTAMLNLNALHPKTFWNLFCDNSYRGFFIKMLSDPELTEVANFLINSSSTGYGLTNALEILPMV